jgi:ABC-type multidrug transport system permease subunit
VVENGGALRAFLVVFYREERHLGVFPWHVSYYDCIFSLFSWLASNTLVAFATLGTILAILISNFKLYCVHAHSIHAWYH